MPNRTHHPRVVLAITVIALTSTATLSETAADVSGGQLSYQHDIHPIFRRHCFGCHQGAKQLGNTG